MIKEATWSVSVQRSRNFFRDQEDVTEESINWFACGTCRITFTGLKPKLLNMTPEESQGYYFDRTCEQLFDVMEIRIPPPAPAKIFDSYNCECCGEKIGAPVCPGIPVTLRPRSPLKL